MVVLIARRAVQTGDHFVMARHSLRLFIAGFLQEVNGSNDYNIECRVLAFETEISSRKALEAFLIV